MSIPTEYLKPGIRCRYRLSERRNPWDEESWEIIEVDVEIIRVTARRVTVRLIDSPGLRLRVIGHDKLHY